MDEVVTTMKQKYTQSRRSRNLDVSAVAGLTDAQAFMLLQQIRFADSGGDPYCPYCFEKRQIRWREQDHRWFCNPCRRAFSLTSGTVWDHQRNSLRRLLIIIANFVTSSSGEPSIQIARKSFTDATATYYTMMKIREALALNLLSDPLSGKCEVDSCWMGGFKRPLNDREHERYLKKTNQWDRPPKKALCAVRERNGRVLIQVHAHERFFVPFIKEHVEPGSTLYVDMAGAWEKLGDTFAVKVINHSEFYWTYEASTQHVEAFFRRVRRAEDIYVHIAGDHLDLYGAEAAFRETYCRHSDAEKFLRVLTACFRHPISRRFAGAYQRKRNS